MFVQFSGHFGQIQTVVPIGFDDTCEQDEAIHHDSHNLSLVSRDEGGCALASMSHIGVCERVVLNRQLWLESRCGDNIAKQSFIAFIAFAYGSGRLRNYAQQPRSSRWQRGDGCQLARFRSSRSAREPCGQQLDVMYEFGWLLDLELLADRNDMHSEHAE